MLGTWPIYKGNLDNLIWLFSYTLQLNLINEMATTAEQIICIVHSGIALSHLETCTFNMHSIYDSIYCSYFQVADCAKLEDQLIEVKGRLEMTDLHVQQVNMGMGPIQFKKIRIVPLAKLSGIFWLMITYEQANILR